MSKKYLSLGERNAYRSLEDVVGCKWSVGVVAALSRGVRRPGELERFIPGISKKILNERLRKLLAYGLITRAELPSARRHVEYHLTPTGQELADVIRRLFLLNQRHEAQRRGPTEGAALSSRSARSSRA